MWYSYRDFRKRVVEDEGDGHASVAQRAEQPDDDGEFELDDVPAEDTLPKLSSTARVLALSECLCVGREHIRESDYDDCTFEVFFDDCEEDTDDLSGDYLVLTDEEVDDRYRSSVESVLLDLGLEGLSINIEDYVDSDYCEETVEEYYIDEANEMSEDALARELLDAGYIDLSDENIFQLKRKEDLGLDDDEEIDADDPDNYEVVAPSWKLADMYVDWKRSIEDFAQKFWELGFGDGLRDDVQYHIRHYNSFPSWFEHDKLLDYLLREQSRAVELAQYDGEEREIELNGNQYYIYRID